MQHAYNLLLVGVVTYNLEFCEFIECVLDFLFVEHGAFSDAELFVNELTLFCLAHISGQRFFFAFGSWSAFGRSEQVDNDVMGAGIGDASDW